MGRPKKCRRICSLPALRRFGPAEERGDGGTCAIQMTVDEYEAVRLVDLLCCTQEECAAQMGAARSTVQAMVVSAHRKLALALAYGQQLWITDGNAVVWRAGARMPGQGLRKQPLCKPLLRMQGVPKSGEAVPQPTLTVPALAGQSKGRMK